jgi:hypothetical protein
MNSTHSVPPAKIVPLYRAICDGVRVGMKIRFSKDVTMAVRSYGATWNGSAKMWIISTSGAKDFFRSAKDVFPSDRFATAGFTMRLGAALRNPVRYALSEHLETTILPVVNGKHRFLAVFMPYDKEILRAVKSLGGFSWRDDGKFWHTMTVPVSRIRSALNAVGVSNDDIYVHREWIAFDKLNEWQCYKPTIKVGESAVIYGADGQPIPVMEPSLEPYFVPMEMFSVSEETIQDATVRFGLYDFQPDGVRHLLRYSGALLADDMGLGKTRQSIVAAILARGDKKSVVVCPASLRFNWQREIIKVCGEDSWVVGQSGEKNSRWWIVSYESVQRVIDENEQFGAMLIDEAQHIKEMSSARTRRTLELGARADRRWLLTGTPVLNDHKELFPLLSISGHPLSQMGPARFAKVFKQKRGNKELAKRISEWLLRRTKDEVLALGQKRESRVHLKLDAPDLFEYRKIFFDKEQTALGKIIGLRRILEEAKLRFISESISDLGKADKAIVFCFYKESVRLLCDSLDEQKIKWVSITGADTPKKRLAAEDAFQSDPKVRICVATIDAAYAGLNLTAANYVYFATLPWTPAKKSQAEDRAYRNGQERDVLVVTPIVLDSIDEQLLELLIYKATIAKDSTEREDDNKQMAEFAESVFSEKPKISLASGG